MVLPDIRVENLRIVPTEVMINYLLKIYVEVHNYGNSTGSETITVTVTGRAPFVRTFSVNPGATSTQVFGLSVEEPGLYQVSVDELSESFIAIAPPGGLTYETITCPICGARLKIGHQALSPDLLIADAQCPKCGTVVAHYVVSIELEGGINISELMNLMITMMIVTMMMKMMMKTMKEVK